jgi:hypothetical protein
VLTLNKPVVRVRYDLEETDPAAFAKMLEPVLELGRAAQASQLVAAARPRS